MDENNPVPKKKKKYVPTGNPMGAPTKYRPEFCSMLIEHMKKGKSFESFGAKIHCGYSTLRTWVTPSHESFAPDFLAAKDIGMAFLLELEEAEFKKGMLGKMKVWTEVSTREGIKKMLVPAKFNAAMAIFRMKNRHHTIYKDRVENVQVDEDGKVIKPQAAVIVNIPNNNRDKDQNDK